MSLDKCVFASREMAREMSLHEDGPNATALYGAGNNELESYTPSNAHVVRGKLIIEAQQSTTGSVDRYFSSKIVSRGKADFGVVDTNVHNEDEEADSSKALERSRRFEAKLKLPWGHGIWPAFWMLPTYDMYGGWPKVGPLFHTRSSS